MLNMSIAKPRLFIISATLSRFDSGLYPTFSISDWWKPMPDLKEYIQTTEAAAQLNYHQDQRHARPGA
jgi:hypothetical protein